MIPPTAPYYSIFTNSDLPEIKRTEMNQKLIEITICQFFSLSELKIFALREKIQDETPNPVLFQLFYFFNWVQMLMRQRRGSVTSDNMHAFSNLSKAEHHDLSCLFKKCDQKEGGISFYDFIEVLKSSFPINEGKKKEILRNITNQGIKILDVNFLLGTASCLKKQKQADSDQRELKGQFFDTFVALGGGSDGSGFITRNNLIATFSQQFQLQVDFNNIDLKGLGQDKLNYQQFCELFQNPQNTIVRTDSVKSVRIREQDFNNYLSKVSI